MGLGAFEVTAAGYSSAALTHPNIELEQWPSPSLATLFRPPWTATGPKMVTVACSRSTTRTMAVVVPGDPCWQPWTATAPLYHLQHRTTTRPPQHKIISTAQTQHASTTTAKNSTEKAMITPCAAPRRHCAKFPRNAAYTSWDTPNNDKKSQSVSAATFSQEREANT